MLRFSKLSFILLVLFAASSVSADAIVDKFSAGPVTVTATTSKDNVSLLQDDLPTTDVLIGRRNTTVQGGLQSGSVEANISPDEGGMITYASNMSVFNGSFDGRLLSYLSNNRSLSRDSIFSEAIPSEIKLSTSKLLTDLFNGLV